MLHYLPRPASIASRLSLPSPPLPFSVVVRILPPVSTHTMNHPSSVCANVCASATARVCMWQATGAGGVIDGCTPQGCSASSGTPTTVDDKFVWGSVTKVLTGTGILRLVSQGVLKLDDPIPQHIDPFIRQMKVVNPAQVRTSGSLPIFPSLSVTSVRVPGLIQSLHLLCSDTLHQARMHFDTMVSHRPHTSRTSRRLQTYLAPRQPRSRSKTSSG